MIKCLIKIIRLVPYWNVNMITKLWWDVDREIRLVPYWNVNDDVREVLRIRQEIRLVPYWNVNAFYIFNKISFYN